ncbi:MAG: hypothetical protein AVDCRST_MAG59-1657, partial [uncultured Thermomicrobiales bacterium]
GQQDVRRAGARRRLAPYPPRCSEGHRRRALRPRRRSWRSRPVAARELQRQLPAQRRLQRRAPLQQQSPLRRHPRQPGLLPARHRLPLGLRNLPEPPLRQPGDLQQQRVQPQRRLPAERALPQRPLRESGRVQPQRRLPTGRALPQRPLRPARRVHPQRRLPARPALPPRPLPRAQL